MPLFLDMLRNETAENPARMQAALAGLRAYQNAPRPPRPPQAPVVGRIGRVTLRGHGAGGPPVLFVPSLINGSEILDLSDQNSMMRGLAARGLDPVLLDWGSPGADEADIDIGGHVERYILPALELLGPDAALAGYCLGGTMSIAAAMLRPPKALALIAAPWDFGGFSSQTRNDLLELWRSAEPVASRFGLLPAEVLQQIFWRIDPSRTIAKFEQFAAKDAAGAEGQNYVAVEDWANDGPPLPFAAGRELMEDLMAGNVSGAGRWTVGGRTVDPAVLGIPILNILSTTDRITPAASAWPGGERIALDEGHVGMVVGRRAPGSLWNHLSTWLSHLRNS
ncbi:polyhydroxyalkanoate synthase [Rhizorhabdus histidinilytica]|uniref:Polyhydroxyalkanoate synthase n=1 Tax=Rhizorhabdus histidinilytica TaxID=439228 RepID=A0A1T5F7E5_9SPHN|nr:polyhydroxyalkanoate synthase [Rhizorhabdus histidinilytica]